MQDSARSGLRCQLDHPTDVAKVAAINDAKGRGQLIFIGVVLLTSLSMGDLLLVGLADVEQKLLYRFFLLQG